MVVAITGANGFIGSHFSKYIESLGEEGKENLIIHIPHALLDDVAQLKRLFDRAPIDIIIHCAAYGNMSFQQDEQEIFQANVVKTWNLLTASKDINYKRFIFISSSSVFGEKYKPMEDDDTLDTDTFYGSTKVAGEYLCRAFRAKYHKPIEVVRPFSVYGEGEADFRFIPTVCRALLEDKEFNLIPLDRHDWIHVEDFVRLTMESSSRLKCIGTGISTCNYDVVTMLERISGKRAKFNEKSLRDADELPYCPIWVCSHNLGTQIVLEEGLKKVWEYEQQRFNQTHS